MQTRTSSYAAAFKIQRPTNNERIRLIAERNRTKRYAHATRQLDQQLDQLDQQFDQHDKFDQLGQLGQLGQPHEPNGRIWTRYGFVAKRTRAFRMLRDRGSN